MTQVYPKKRPTTSTAAITSTEPATLNATRVMKPTLVAVPSWSPKVTSVDAPIAKTSHEKRSSTGASTVTSTPMTAATAHAMTRRGMCHECASGISRSLCTAVSFTRPFSHSGSRVNGTAPAQ